MENKSNKDTVRSDSLLANIAILYFGEGLTQNEIAKRVGVSRASVVSYLREGRERGIVDIHINGQALASSSLSRQLRTKFDLADVYIAKYTRNQDRMKQTAHTGAMALLDIIKPGDHIGVAWGETIGNVADFLPRTMVKNTSVSQVIGAMHSSRLPSAEACSIKMANRIGAECFTLHAPAKLSSVELTNSLKREPTVRSQLERLNDLSVVLFSVGDCSKTTHLLDTGIASIDDLNEAKSLGAKGVVCSRFINAEGKQVEIGLNDHLISIDIPTLQRAEKRILVVSGLAKLEAVIAALNGGLVSHLIVDDALANALAEDKN